MKMYFDPIFSKYQFQFRKEYSAQQCLLITTEKWRTSLDQNGNYIALLTHACLCRMYKRMKKYFGPIFSKYQFQFRKEDSTQQCLLITIEKWKTSLDQNGNCAALLTHDCLPNDLLIAKLRANGCDLLSLKFLNSYLRNRCQRVKLNNFYSS